MIRRPRIMNSNSRGLFLTKKAPGKEGGYERDAATDEVGEGGVDEKEGGGENGA